MRVGLGFDVHPFTDGRRLVLGGVEIPEARGLAGHSDADVLCHAVADACLGAAALGDLGAHFPDDDPRWRDASSLDLLERVRGLVAEAGLAVASTDATVLCEAPKLASYLPEMRRNLARALDAPEGAVSVKATRAEGLGTIGRREGAACMAVALLAPVSTGD